LFAAPSNGQALRGASQKEHCVQVVSAAGAVDHSQLVQLAEKAFSGLPSEGLSSKEYIDKASLLQHSFTWN